MTSVGTSLPYSTLDDESNELNRLKKRIHSNRTMTRTKKSKNKTRKKSNQVESMLDYIRQQDEEKEKNDLEESFDMLKPTLSRNTREEDEDSTTSEEDKPEFLRKRAVRPLLDDSQSNDPIQFHDPQRYASLVKEYGSDMLKPWSAPDGAGQISSEEQRKQYQRQPIQSQGTQGTQGTYASTEGFAGLSESMYDSTSSERSSIMEKMNYMIHLLEDQKDTRTESVNEELILYLFLGIFVIFVTDSFTRVGKYTR